MQGVIFGFSDPDNHFPIIQIMLKNKSLYTSFPVFLAFLCMGFGDVVGPLTGLIKEEFQLSNFVAQLIPFMGFLMFGILSIPMGIIQDRIGKKQVLLTGLGLAFTGLLLPMLTGFGFFGILLFSILLLGAGASLLQVAGNPIMRDVSPAGKYSRNLSLAQFIKALGSLSGALIPLIAVNYLDKDWRILFPIYSATIAITMMVLWLSSLPRESKEKSNPATFRSSFRLLGNPFVLTTTLGIFLYVGAEVSLSSGLPIFLQDRFGIDLARLGLIGTLFFFIALTAGRFLGALLLNWIKPAVFLTGSILVSMAGFAGLFFGGQPVAMISIFLLGLGFANVFPLIFSIAVDSMPERSNELSGLMVTAILGGAVIPPLMGALADRSNTLIALLVPLACILYIGILSIRLNQKYIRA